MRFQGHINNNMFAPCGINCKVCYKHLKDKNACNGCLVNDDHKPERCRKCKIKVCAKTKGISYCYECEEFPCKQIKYMEKSYTQRYGTSLIQNSLSVKTGGLDAFMQNEKVRWTCLHCGGIISLHDAQCSECHLEQPLKPAYELETQRLGFRQWKESDKFPFFQMNSNPEVMEFFPSLLNEEQSNGFFDRIKKHFNQYGYGLWAVEIKETQDFIGFIGLSNPTFESFFTPCVEIGWRIMHKYWDNGYATEGAKACLNYGLNVLKLKEIYSFTAEINTRSIKVMRKIGMVEMGSFNHPKLEIDSPLRVHVLYRKIEGDK